MSKINDGGAAFPRPASDYDEHEMPVQDGMSLRDYFAAQVIGILVHTTPLGHAVKTAYAAADAMIAERSKQENPR